MIKYGVAGFSATATHLGILFIMVNYFETPKVNATNIGFVCAMIVNYSIQQTYVFPNNKNKIISFTQYTFITSAVFCLNWYLFEYLIISTNINYLVCQFIVTIFIFILNFFMNKYFTFRY